MLAGDIDAKINSTMQVIYDSGEMTSTASTVSITGLNGDADQEYYLIARIVCGLAGGSSYYIRPNNSSTTDTYGRQTLTGTLGTAAATRSTDKEELNFAYADDINHLTFSDVTFYVKSGYVRTAINNRADGIDGTTVTTVGIYGHSWNETSANITSLVLLGDGAGCFNTGSRLILLKKVLATGNMALSIGELDVRGVVKNTWQEIYRNEFTSTTATSITISGLKGNTDVLYRLRTRIVNGTNTASYIFLKMNADGGTNYGYQYLLGYITTVLAGRGTDTNMGMGCIGVLKNELGSSESLIYAKSGYVRTALTKRSESVSGTTLGQTILLGFSWNNTADEITSILVSSDQVNCIGSGSIISLERLNL